MGPIVLYERGLPRVSNVTPRELVVATAAVADEVVAVETVVVERLSVEAVVVMI